MSQSVIVLNHILEEIARQITYIDTDLMNCAELNIARILVDRGYLEKFDSQESFYYKCVAK